MKRKNKHSFRLFVFFWLLYATLQAQTVVKVSQVLPFANVGTVSSVAKGEEAVVITSSSSTTPTPADRAIVTTEGGKIVTGTDGAASLLLGSSGTARMDADSEVKVPEDKETNHSLELIKGKLFLNISGDELKKRAAGDFKLKTPAALLAVKGTKFFTISANGTDTIGVHEGSVEVTEPTSGKSVTLAPGEVVSVSLGSISETRSVTGDEQTYSTQYELASMEVLPLGLVVEMLNSSQPAAIFKSGKLAAALKFDIVSHRSVLPDKVGPHVHFLQPSSRRIQTTQTRVLTPDGAIRYSWTRDQPISEYLQIDGDNPKKFGRAGGSGEFQQRYLTRALGARFRLRAKNVVGVNLACTGSYRSGSSKYTTQTRSQSRIQPAADGGWTNVLFPFPRGFQDGLVTLRLESAISGKQPATNAQQCILDMSDFELLLLPK